MQAILNNNFFMQIKSNLSSIVFLKPLVFVVSLIPFVLLVWGALNNELGPNPVEAIIRTLGDWGMYFLLIGLSISPVRKIFKLNPLIQYRRMLGLFAFFYVSMHFLAYIWFDQFFNLEEIINDIVKRPFITVGFVCFVLLIPLVLTSTKSMIRRLGKNWGRLHSLVYPISILALLHYFMMIKADYLQPGVLLLILTVLLAYRFIPKLKSYIKI